MMADKAYIVANDQQEREVLENLEQEGLVWTVGDKKPTEFRPSECHAGLFPYVLINRGDVRWSSLNEFNHDATVIYDGRKEKQMSEKYVVSQEFMNGLEEWKAGLNINGQYYVSDEDLFDTPVVIEVWWKDNTYALEQNNRLIAIIRWVNGEDVFEVEKPKKWVVRSKYSSDEGEHLYVMLFIGRGIKDTTTLWGINNATKFDTKEEAESWANAHQEVVEVEA